MCCHKNNHSKTCIKSKCPMIKTENNDYTDMIKDFINKKIEDGWRLGHMGFQTRKCEIDIDMHKAIQVPGYTLDLTGEIIIPMVHYTKSDPATAEEIKKDLVDRLTYGYPFPYAVSGKLRDLED